MKKNKKLSAKKKRKPSVNSKKKKAVGRNKATKPSFQFIRSRAWKLIPDKFKDWNATLPFTKFLFEKDLQPNKRATKSDYSKLFSRYKRKPRKQKRKNNFKKINDLRSKIWRNFSDVLKANGFEWSDTAKIAAFILKNKLKTTVKEIGDVVANWIYENKQAPPLAPQMPPESVTDFWGVDHVMQDILRGSSEYSEIGNLAKRVHADIGERPHFNIEDYDYDTTFKGFVDEYNKRLADENKGSGDYRLKIEFEWNDKIQRVDIFIFEVEDDEDKRPDSLITDGGKPITATPIAGKKGKKGVKSKPTKTPSLPKEIDFKKYKKESDERQLKKAALMEDYTRFEKIKEQKIKDIDKYRELGLKKARLHAIKELTNVMNDIDEIVSKLRKLKG